MQNCHFLGIIKFFKNEDYLTQLREGKLFCSTPEYYRLHDEKGASDRFECCTWSFRQSRGDTGARIVVDGHAVQGLTNVTLRSTGMKDGWLHCWTRLLMPEDEAELEQLVVDIRRIRSEFGLHYAYVPEFKIKSFIGQIKDMTTHEVRAGNVIYSEDPTDWSSVCKSIDYQYQREFRILIGECDELSVEPLILQAHKGFDDLIMKDISIEISSKDGEWIWFRIDGTRDIVHNKKGTQ